MHLDGNYRSSKKFIEEFDDVISERDQNNRERLRIETREARMSLEAPNVLSLLYEQHYAYTSELGRTHQKLSNLYKKLSKVERTLSEREERHMTRDERKKLQFSRVLTKRAVRDLEAQQGNLHDALRQCKDLIGSLEDGAYSWSPFWYTPFHPIAFSPYNQRQPQYWDLTSLPERSQSPDGSRSPDIGFHEPVMGRGGAAHAHGGATSSAETSSSNPDNVLKGIRSHKRCVSLNAVEVQNPNQPWRMMRRMTEASGMNV
jgi:hypothetical protein